MMRRTSIGASLVAALSTPAFATNTIVIETRILAPDPQAGMKSRHTITVDPASCRSSQTVTTGTTDFFGISLASVRDRFVVKDLHCANGVARFKVVGETASGVRALPSIDYDFGFEISPRGVRLKGCHDGYPAYQVTVDRRLIYEFRHRSVALLNLFGTCDTTVDLTTQ